MNATDSVSCLGRGLRAAVPHSAHVSKAIEAEIWLESMNDICQGSQECGVKDDAVELSRTKY